MGGCLSAPENKLGDSAALVAKEQAAAAIEETPQVVEKKEEPKAMNNDALVFIKPHAANENVKELVMSFLEEKGIKILSEGVLQGEEIDKKGIIDNHYSHIATIAMKTSPANLPVADDKKEGFAETFGKGSWDELAEDGKIVNLAEFKAQHADMSFDEINAVWDKSKTFKLAPGTYCGYLEEFDTFILNAFYGTMRQVYTDPDATVIYFTVSFPEDKVSWKDFRGKVIGATDPSKAPAGSLRGKIYSDYEALGIAEKPNVGENGVHASAGPIEGLRERQVWLGQKLENDPYGKELLKAKVNKKLIESWLANERVTINGETDNAFDLLEDINSSEALKIAIEESSKL